MDKRLPKAKKSEFYELHLAEIKLQETAIAAYDQLTEVKKLPSLKELNVIECRTSRADS